MALLDQLKALFTPPKRLMPPPPGATPFMPGRAEVEAYGNGGFRFADMSHRGSILCLPSGILAWDISDPSAITEASLQPVLAESRGIDTLLVGTGREIIRPDESLLWTLRAANIRCEFMTTGAAIQIYNILLGENRAAAAALIAVD